MIAGATVGGFKVRRAVWCLGRDSWRAGPPSCPGGPARPVFHTEPCTSLQPHLARTAQSPSLLLSAITVQNGPQALVSSRVTSPSLTFRTRSSLASVPLASFTLLPCSLTPQPPPPLCVARAVAGSPVRAPCCACSVPARAPVEERGTLALELGPPPPQPPNPSQSPPSPPRPSSTHPPPSSGIKYKSIPSSLSYPVVKFQIWGVVFKGPNMLPKLIDWQCKSVFLRKT